MVIAKRLVGSGLTELVGQEKAHGKKLHALLGSYGQMMEHELVHEGDAVSKWCLLFQYRGESIIMESGDYDTLRDWFHENYAKFLD